MGGGVSSSFLSNHIDRGAGKYAESYRKELVDMFADEYTRLSELGLAGHDLEVQFEKALIRRERDFLDQLQKDHPELTNSEENKPGGAAQSVTEFRELCIATANNIRANNAYTFLVAVDGSDAGDLAFRAGMHFRRKLDNLCLMHVYNGEQTDSDGSPLPLNFRQDAVRMRYENDLLAHLPKDKYSLYWRLLKDGHSVKDEIVALINDYSKVAHMRMAPGYDLDKQRKRQTAEAVDAVATTAADKKATEESSNKGQHENEHEEEETSVQRNDESSGNVSEGAAVVVVVDPPAAAADSSLAVANAAVPPALLAAETETAPPSSSSSSGEHQHSHEYNSDDTTALDAILQGLPTDKLPDFFVMGYAGRRGFSKDKAKGVTTLGSVADLAMRAVHMPIIIIKQPTIPPAPVPPPTTHTHATVAAASSASATAISDSPTATAVTAPSSSGALVPVSVVPPSNHDNTSTTSSSRPMMVGHMGRKSSSISNHPVPADNVRRRVFVFAVDESDISKRGLDILLGLLTPTDILRIVHVYSPAVDEMGNDVFQEVQEYYQKECEGSGISILPDDSKVVLLVKEGSKTSGETLVDWVNEFTYTPGHGPDAVELTVDFFALAPRAVRGGQLSTMTEYCITHTMANVILCKN